MAATALARRYSDDAGGVGGDDLPRGGVSCGVCDRTHGCGRVSGQCLSTLRWFAGGRGDGRRDDRRRGDRGR